MCGRNLGESVNGTADKRTVSLTASYWALIAQRRVNGEVCSADRLLERPSERALNSGCCRLHPRREAAEFGLGVPRTPNDGIGAHR